MQISFDTFAKFESLKSEISQHQRLSGHYSFAFRLISPLEILVSLADVMRELTLTDKSPTEWLAYEVEEKYARSWLTQALIGGSRIGHLSQTISSDKAIELVGDFFQLFTKPTRFFTNQGRDNAGLPSERQWDDFGNSEFTFSYGVAVMDEEKIGVIWILEND